MRGFWWSCFATMLLVLAVASATEAQSPSKQAATALPRSVKPKAVALPLFFEANQGQTDPRVRFLTRSSGYTLFLTPSETVFAEEKNSLKRTSNPQAVVRMQLVGANAAPLMKGLDQLPGKVNYLIGNDPSQWHTGVSLYSDVRAEQVYPGVDLLFHGDKRQLEYDFLVSPGADPTKIAFRIRGTARIEVNSQGDLVLHTTKSQFLMYKPVVYQTIASERRAIEGSFVRKGKNEIAFKLGAYDRTQALVIDPAIGYSTFLGGAGSDAPTDLQVDGSNPAAPKVYVAGSTTDTTTFPETSNPLIGVAGGQEYGYIAKIDPTITSGGTGSLDYLTFIGGKTLIAGNNGTACATVFGKLSLDLSLGTSSVEPVVGGLTSCGDYPGTPTQTVGGLTAGVLTRLTAAGNAADVSIVFGGNGQYFDIYPFVDSAGNVVVAGATASTNLPVTPNAYISTINDGNTGYADCFVAKLQRSNLSPTYMTYVNAGEGTTQGGSGFGGVGIGCGALEEAGGKLGIGGSTLSPFVFNVGSDGQNFANGFEPFFPDNATKAVFILRLDPTQSGTDAFVYGTYFGGGGITNARTGALDLGNGAIAVAGTTSSNSFDDVGDIPLQNAFQSTNLAAASSSGNTGFLLVIDTTQTGQASLLCSTYFGGSSGFDEIDSLSVDPSDPTAFRLLLGGVTGSASDFPISNSIESFQGTQDGFVSELTVPFPAQAFNATLDFSTFVGGGDGDQITGVGVDANGTMYAAGKTESSGFFGNTYPVTTVNGFQQTCTSCGAAQPEEDTVVFSLTPAASATLQTISISPVTATIAAGQTQQFQAEGFFSDGTVQNLTNLVTWSFTQTAVATINAQGLVTAGASAGNTTIVASDGAATGEASVAVTVPGEFSLTIVLNGSAYGSVSGTPLSCNNNNGYIAGTCTAVFPSGTLVTLNEQPFTLSVFGGWSGGGCSGTATSCAVTVTADTTVAATFNTGAGTNPITITPGTIANGMGTGTGTVTSSQNGINCSMSDGTVTSGSGSCAANFTTGSYVTLTATPAAGSVFNFWGGNCGASSATTCKLLAYTPQTATATFTAVNYALGVVGEGTGAGTVSSVPSGLNCTFPTTTCSANFPIGTQVVLSATPSAGSTFAGWSNFGCTGTGTCTLTMTQAFTVTATFNTTVTTFALTVTDAGTGTGAVTSQAGLSPVIDCVSGSTTGCSQNYNSGQSVTLTAAPTGGSTFAGWSGACTGTSTCMVTMSAAENVTATFNTTTYPLTVQIVQNAPNEGTVTSTNPTGISCPGTCTDSFTAGTQVTLTASPNSGSTFTGWSGAPTACVVSGATCTLNMPAAAETVTANFSVTVTTFALTVTDGGTGSGTVTSQAGLSPAINCTTGSSTGCSANYPAGTQVTLMGAETSGSTFEEFSSNCAPTGSNACTVTVSAPVTVTATFNSNTPPSDIRTALVPFVDDGSAPVTVTWNPAFADTNYTAVCTAETTGDFVLPVITGRTASSMTVIPTDGGATPGVVDCIAIPDSDTSDIRHGRTPFSDEQSTISVTWGTAFPDTNYTVACTLESEGLDGGFTSVISDVETGFVTVDNSNFLTGTMHCIAVPDTSTTAMAHARAGLSGQVPTVTLTWNTAFSNASYAAACSDVQLDQTSSDAAIAIDPGMKLPASVTVVNEIGSGTIHCLGYVATPTLLSLGVTPSSGTVQAGSTLQFTATGNYSDGSTQNVTTGATWSSSNTEVATIGNVTGTQGLATGVETGGPVTITGVDGSLTATALLTVTAAPQFTLSVSLAGTGGGTVTSNTGGIDCGESPGECTGSYNSGTVVTLTAVAQSGSVFGGFSSNCVPINSTSCTITMSAAEGVTATFNLPPPNFELTVSLAQGSQASPGGTGTVTSQAGLNPPINCISGSTEECVGSYPSGTVVTLTATPASGSAFTGWSGACTGTGTCAVTMNAAESVTATFSTSTFTLTTGPGYTTTTTTTPGGNIVVGLTLSSNTPTTVDLGCTSSAPQYLSCLITPAQVSLTGNGPSQVAIVLTSYCQGRTPGMPGGLAPGLPGGMVGVALLGLALCVTAWSYRGRRRMALSYALLLFAAVCGAACGNLPKGTAGATPPGNYTLTVTATVAGQAPQAVQLTVVVQ